MKQDINSTVNQLFFHLLSAAIWDKEADATLFKGLDDKTWKQIADMAIRQSVSALIADKALSLPQDCLPSRALKLQFLAFVQQTEALNQKMIKVLGNLKDEYDEAGFPFCLLKGLSVGVNYPKPLLRSAGDIDLYLYGKGDYERVREWLVKKGYEVLQNKHIHYQYEIEGVWIENHNRFTFFHNRKYDKRLKECEKELIEGGEFTSVAIEGITVQQLPIDVNALFVFQHMFSHFIDLGVGFRQICDWLLFLSTHKDKIDVASFTELATRFALLYPMQVFARAAVKYLGTPESVFPFEMTVDDRHVEMVIEDILYSGNFGFHRSDASRPKEKLSGMWFSYKTTIHRSLKFGQLSHEHSKKLPFEKLITRLKIAAVKT